MRRQRKLQRRVEPSHEGNSVIKYSRIVPRPSSGRAVITHIGRTPLIFPIFDRAIQFLTTLRLIVHLHMRCS
jgi:hypothetical protein